MNPLCVKEVIVLSNGGAEASVLQNQEPANKAVQTASEKCFNMFPFAHLTQSNLYDATCSCPTSAIWPSRTGEQEKTKPKTKQMAGGSFIDLA